MRTSLFSLFLFTLLGTNAVFAQSLSVSGVGIYRPAGMPEGLSGLTYAGGNQYYACDDSGGVVTPLNINVNTLTGAISSAAIGTSMTFGGADIEGIAWDPAGNSGAGSLFVSDETGASIKQYNSSGSYLSSVSVPAIYNNYRTNKSLESLTISKNIMWTANEEALSVDGPLSTSSAGTTLRLQKFTNSGGNWQPAGQFAYNTLPWGGDSTWTSGEISGVSDLCVLPNGKLLVLERRLNGVGTLSIPRFENHLYEVDLSAATDVSAFSGLAGASYSPVSKSLLWSGTFGLDDNFEGLCLGPQLDNGDWSLLMVSDGDGDQLESLYSLRLAGDVPEPTSLLILAVSIMAISTKPRKTF